MVKLFIIIVSVCLALPIHVQAFSNPTKLWELRDSLQVLKREGHFQPEVNILLTSVPDISKRLTTAITFLGTRRLRIDVVSYACDSSSEKERVASMLKNRAYMCIAAECDTDFIRKHAKPDSLFSVTNTALKNFVEVLGFSNDARLRHIADLGKSVQCEIALVEMTHALRKQRTRIGEEIDGLLVVDYYFVEKHLKSILNLFRAKTNL